MKYRVEVWNREVTTRYAVFTIEADTDDDAAERGVDKANVPASEEFFVVTKDTNGVEQSFEMNGSLSASDMESLAEQYPENRWER